MYDTRYLMNILVLICPEFKDRNGIVGDPVFKMIITLKEIVDTVVYPIISETQR